jgi:F-box protein 3
MTRWTQHFRTRLNLPDNDPDVMFAAGFNFNKVINCITNTGDVMVSHVPGLTRHGEGAQSPPKSPPPAFSAIAALQAQDLGYPVLSSPSAPDATLQWFEFYAEALSNNRFTMEILYDEIPTSTGICLFPRHFPLGPSANTRGIHVTASPLFIPELSNLRDVDDGDMQYFFAYSIRFRLLSEEEQRKEMMMMGNGSTSNSAGGDEGAVAIIEEDPFQSVQLLDRAWKIYNSAGAVESEVRGEAVIGQYPLLLQGGENFTYQSCTHQREPQGSMDGEFTFIEGSIEQPGARHVKAKCPRFQLVMPDVVF